MTESNDLKDKLEYIKRCLYQKKGRKPTEIELSEVLGISVEELQVLNAPVESPARAEAYAKYLQELEMAKSVLRNKQDLIDALSSKERQVIKMTLGMDDGREHTTTEISEILEIPPKVVGQIRHSALLKLSQQA